MSRSKSTKQNNKKASFRGNGKWKSNKDTSKEVLNKGDRDNDPNWYFSSSELANQAAQLSFQNVLGLGGVRGYEIPNIARCVLASTPGVTYNWTNKTGAGAITDGSSLYYYDPKPGKAGVNLMAAKLYTLLSTFSGRTSAYAPQDVACMILAVSSIAELSESIRRMFGVALTYNYRNRMLPLGILASLGVEPNDVVANIAAYRMRYNIAMSRINQIPLLDNVGYIKKSRDIYQRIYMDDPTSMSQLFFYTPQFVWIIDETSYSGGTVLKAVDLPYWSGIPTAKMDDWLTILEDAITAVLESSTLNFIYADLLNMSNKLNAPTWQFDYLAENYVVMPEYNANALLQFHNLTVIQNPEKFWDNTGTTISQTGIMTPTGYSPITITNYWDVVSDANTNEVVFNPIWWSFGTVAYQSTWNLVDMPTDQPTVEDRIEALRFMSSDSGLWVNPGDISGIFVPSSAGPVAVGRALPDHVCVGLDIIDNITSTGLRSNSVYATARQLAGLNTIVSSKLSQFEHAPMVFAANTSGGGTIARLYYQTQFYTEIDYDYIKRLNDLVTIGLFDFRV